VTSRCRLIGALLVAALLTGCSPGPGGLDREPHPFDDALPQADVSGIQVPVAFAESLLVDPGWAMRPQEADGIFLAAVERSEALEYIAVDSDGTVLWAAERPLSCSGFTLTEDAEGRALAVLTDTTSTEDAFGELTASAYDLATGDPVWGPVDVPGPYQGPGLVFAAPPEQYMGETGPRTALDPATGQVTAAEDRLDEARIIGEFRGVVLVADDTSIIGFDGHGGRELWRTGADRLGGDATAISAGIGDNPGPGLAQLQIEDTGDALIDLTDGSVLGYPIRDAATESATGTRIIIDATHLRAFDADENELWSQPISGQTRIAASSEDLHYLEGGGWIRPHHVRTGDVTPAYDPDDTGPVAVPSLIADTGAAILDIGQHTLLMTTKPRPGNDQ